jgi:putative transposase
MGLRFSGQVHGSCFFVTTAFRGHARLGEIKGVYEAVCDSMRFYLDKLSAAIIAYVLMPSHIHFVIVIEGDKLGAFMRDFKKFTSQKSIRDLGIAEDRVWEDGYDRVGITSESVLRTKIEYIHANPIRAGLVSEPQAWLWSSDGFYATGRPGPLAVWTGWF